MEIKSIQISIDKIILILEMIIIKKLIQNQYWFKRSETLV